MQDGILVTGLISEDREMIDQTIKDEGTIAVLMLELKEDHLPRAKRLLEKVNQGEKLSDSNIRFLEDACEDATSNPLLMKRHPEYHTLISRVMNLYTEIIIKGLENEKLP